jgi:lipooligosaccharide transport system permease protein
MSNWQGATKLVDIQKVKRFGAWYVAEHRLRTMSKWITSIIGFGLGNPVLYLLAIGLGVGALVNENTGGIAGVDYLTFLAPALLATAAIQAGMDETSFPTLQGFLWGKYFWSMNATQLRPIQIAGGVLIAAFARVVLTVALYLLILLIFGAVSAKAIPALVLCSLLAGLAFASAMLATASYVVEDDGFFAIVGRFIVGPMFLFSGTFYPLELMPIYLQWIGWVSPLWHATSLGRHFSFGLPVEPWLLAVHFGYLVAIAAVGLVLAGRKFEERLSA